MFIEYGLYRINLLCLGFIYIRLVEYFSIIKLITCYCLVQVKIILNVDHFVYSIKL